MGLTSEYIAKKISAKDLEAELLGLIKQYNKKRGTFLVVYSGAVGKNIPQVSLGMDDYFTLFDILKNVKSDKLDFYIETPGGSGEAAEEIVRFVRKKFKEVSFVISGEAKSAGTIMVLSGDKILMTESGSLGPIDAQVKIGRCHQSAYDYIDWVQKRRSSAVKTGKLNPFDATMVAQISPGELEGVNNALHFAKDLVIEWLPKYMFKNWDKVGGKSTAVTQKMKEKKAKDIVEELINHKKWRSHGRSLKINDLENIGLQIEKIDEDKELCDIVYKLHAVIRMLYATTNAFKIFATQDEKIFGNVAVASMPPRVIPANAEVAEAVVECPQCKTRHKLYMKFIDKPQIDKDMTEKGNAPFPKDNKLTCSCGFVVDLTGLRNQIEQQIGKKVLI